MLTIAQASGLIAGGLMIVSYVLPLALVVILVRYVGNENSAATWSSINRTISNTIWPLLLQTDAVGAENRTRSAVVLNWSVTIGALMIAAAGVLTPLGLHERVGPESSAQPVYFEYAKDKTPWGRVTMDRPDTYFGRYCELGTRINCPAQYQGVYMKKFPNGTWISVKENDSSFVNTTIPANYTAMFSSATDDEGMTLSGLFDIQYRQWRATFVDLIDNGAPRIKGVHRYIENLIPMDDVLIREGLVIDVRDNPGIGFRNHTTPMDLVQGGTWSEDLTWLEPVTSCVDTNLTIEITIEDTVEKFGENKTSFLVDRGAFRDLDLGALETPPWNDNQTLDLYGRAYKAARMHNVIVARTLNLSLPLARGNETIPRFKIQSSEELRDTLKMDSTLFSTAKTELIQLGDIAGIKTEYNDPQNVSVPSSFVDHYPDGRRKLFASNFTAIEDICRGFYTVESTLDYRSANITNPAVKCGRLVGAGRSTRMTADGTLASSLDGRETIHRNMYICASGIKASIKKVDFLYNGTNSDLSNLKVTGISDKVYPDEKSKPLWAVEHSEPYRMTFDPLWGMVNDSYETTEGFYTTRSEHLWLPALAAPEQMLGSNVGWDSLAARQAPVLAVWNAYNILAGNDQYTGDNLYSLVERFMKLSANESSASNIPSLIMADTLASTLVGTKTSIRKDSVVFPAQLSVNDPPKSLPSAQVVPYSREITYDLRYSIPAIVVLSILLFALLWALSIIALTRGGIIQILRDIYNQTSTGRLATALLFPGRSDPSEPSSKWVNGDGKLVLKFGRIGIRKDPYFMAILDAENIPEYKPEVVTSPVTEKSEKKDESTVTTALIREGYEVY